ncbi:MAG TPA: phosphatidate cytidylyltransferase [Gemmatimonadaceae bacterium]
MNELTRRLLFALVGAPLMLGLIYAGGWILAGSAATVSAIGAWELLRMQREAGADPLEPASIIIAAAIPLVVHAHYLGVFDVTVTEWALVLVVLIASTIWTRGVSQKPMASAAATLFAALYPTLIAFVYALRSHEYTVGAVAGTALVMYPVATVWATDTGAYTIGRLVGGRKLMPSISPGKTVAGAIGGVSVALIVSVLYARFVLPPLAQLGVSVAGALAFGVAVSVAAQTGDLAESLFKRDAGVKDSSRLLPGHGGILDRFDGLYFALPVAYLALGHLLFPVPGR